MLEDLAAAEPSAAPDSAGTPEREAPSRARRLFLGSCVAALGLVVDLWTKAWAWEHLRGKPPRELIEQVFHLEFGFNTGSAFGLLREQQWARLFFIVVTLAALAYMLRLALTMPRRFASGFVAVGLITGGALGNLHDRLFRVMDVFGHGEKHGVVDFIVVFYWPGQRWPAFNVADAVLVAGVGLFMIYLHRHGDETRIADATA